MNDTKKTLADGTHEMTLEHVEEIKHIMAHAFLQNNEIWSSFKIQKEQILQFFDRLIRGHLTSQERSKHLYGPQICHSMISVENGKINSFILHYELHDYHAIQQQAQPQSLEIFRSLEKEGKELMKCVNVADYPPGQALYANFGGQNPKVQMTGLMKVIQFIIYHMRLKQSGFRWIVGRVSNSKAMTLYKKIGARVIKQVTFERNGKQFPLFFFDFDLHGDRFNFCEASLPQLIEISKKNSSPVMPKL